VIIESRQESIINTLVYYSALIINIFLGWVLVRINTHYLEIAAYGQYAFFVTIILFGRSLFDFGVFEASARLLTATKTDEERRILFGTGLLWAMVFAVFSVIALHLSGMLIDHFFEVKIGALCRQFSYGLGLYILIAYLTRSLRGSGSIKTLAVLSIIPRVLYLFLLSAVILFARFSLESTLSMMFFGIILTLIGTWIYLKPSFAGWRRQSRLIREEVKTYGRYIYVSTVWAELLIHADKFIISYFLNDQGLAYYALAVTLALPLSHFSTSLATSLFNRFARVDMISTKIIRGNLLFVVVSVVVFILLRRPIIYYLFSVQYEPSIDLLLPLSMAFGLSGLSKPYNMFLMANRHGKIVRNISMLIPTIQIIAAVLVIPGYGISGVAWVTFYVYSLDLILYILAYQRVVNLPLHQLF
jgi:O-antigen/teichoic acid export membrane protein